MGIRWRVICAGGWHEVGWSITALQPPVKRRPSSAASWQSTPQRLPGELVIYRVCSVWHDNDLRRAHRWGRRMERAWRRWQVAVCRPQFHGFRWPMAKASSMRRGVQAGWFCALDAPVSGWAGRW